MITLPFAVPVSGMTFCRRLPADSLMGALVVVLDQPGIDCRPSPARPGMVRAESAPTGKQKLVSVPPDEVGSHPTDCRTPWLVRTLILGPEPERFHAKEGIRWRVLDELR